jgi:hypothetical protein
MWLRQPFPRWDDRTKRAAWLGCLRAESKRASTSRFDCRFLPRGPNGGRGMPLQVWFTLLRSSALICPRRLPRSHGIPDSRNAENQCLWYTGASSESVSSLSETSTPATSRLWVTAKQHYQVSAPQMMWSSHFKLSLCLIKHHSMKTYERSGGIAPRVVNLHSRRRWVDSFHAPATLHPG